MLSLKGTWTVLITPFDPHGDLDIPGLRILVQEQLKSRINGLVILGTTGEKPTLSEDEQQRIVEIVAEEVDHQIPLMINVGTNSTAKTIDSLSLAAKFGQMALVVVPYYNKPTQEGIYTHFKMIAENSPVPIVLYNIPSRSGQNMEVETVVRLSHLPNIIGIKECSHNLNQIMQIIEKASNPHFSMISGNDNLTFPILCLGGNGVISSACNLIPSLMKEMVDETISGNLQRGRELHYALLPIFRALSLETNPIPLKAALNLNGLPAGPCRLPLTPLMPHHESQLREILAIAAEALYGSS